MIPFSGQSDSLNPLTLASVKRICQRLVALFILLLLGQSLALADLNRNALLIGDEAWPSSSLAWADWDGDGDLDLAIGNRGQPLRIYENDEGQLRFDPANADPAQQFGWQAAQSRQTTSLAWGDWDWDGDLDLAVGNDGQPNQVYQNDGGQLSLIWQAPQANNTTAIAWGDWNGGNLALAVANADEPNQVYQNDEGLLTLAWQSPRANNTTAIAWGDWNGDGQADLAIANRGQPNRVYQSDGPSFSLAWQAPTAESSTSMAWGDWNLDGLHDLAVANDGRPNRIYQNTGQRFVTIWQSPDSSRSTSIAWGDWNRDDLRDLAVGNLGQPNQVFEHTGSTLSLAWQSSDQAQTTAIAWGALDPQNGHDLAAANDGQRNQLYVAMAPFVPFGLSRSGLTEEDTRPLLRTGIWHSPSICAPGRCGGGKDIYVRNFVAPPGAVEVEIDAYWVWDGSHIGHEQNEESFFVLAAGQQGFCEDRANGPVPDDEALCWQTAFARSDNLEIMLRHAVEAGQEQTAESVRALVEVRWYGAPAPPACNSVELSLPSGSDIPPSGAATDAIVNGSNATRYRLVHVEDDGSRTPVTEEQRSNQFTDVPVSPGESYQAQAGTDNGQWSSTGCQFHYDLQVQDATGTANCSGGSVSNPNPFSIDVLYRVDGQLVFQGQVSANATRPIAFSFNDGQTHTAQFTWAGNGQDGTVGLGNFGPCGAAPPTGTATCTGGSITNPNSFAINVVYAVDGITQFNGQVAANSTQPVGYSFNDGVTHNAQFSWDGNGQNGIVNLGAFGPCGAATPIGTAGCSGGSVTNPNSFSISVAYTVDGVTRFSGQIAANSTQPVAYAFNDGALHAAQFTWAGNGQNGTVNLGSFGPCSAATPNGTATCNGGSITNPNAFAIDVTYRVDGQLVFQGQVPANSSQPIAFSFNDGATHSAQFTWSGNNQNGTVNLGSFGPCGAATPTGTATCSGGSVTNPNPFPINVVYTVDGQTLFQGQVTANTAQPITFSFNDGATHTAQFTWDGNGQNGTVDLGTFGPCGATIPIGTAGCDGGSVTNPNPFSINIVYTVDGQTIFQGQVAANASQVVAFSFNDGLIHSAQFIWDGNGQNGTIDLGTFGPCGAETPTGTAGCDGGSVTNPNSFPIQIVYYVDEVAFFNGSVPANSTVQIRYTFQDSDIHTARFTWSGGGSSGAVDLGTFGPCATTSGQYQDFIGPVPFGTYSPHREPGKEYFLGPRSLMVNVEYLTGAGEGEVVFRFNGQELSGITTSLFNNGTFRQIEDEAGRAVTRFETGTTKLIAYRFGLERARLFQTVSAGQSRWLHPLDQPFEHKPQFQLEAHGPPGSTDHLIYGDLQQPISYDKSGQALIDLTYDRPGLVALYSPVDALTWQTVAALRPAITRTQTISYTFAESGLYHYRIMNGSGQIVAGPMADSFLAFEARPGQAYHPQLVYPQTSLFVALYETMAFNHPSGWVMPVDARREHAFEFHLDYHRLPDPDLGNLHIRGDVVVDALYLLNASTSVAQQFPYGRHDGALPGVKLVGIPNVSMVAFCVRPGVHEVVFWGGWENESYYLPERGQIVDQALYDQWTAEQGNDCIDAARRVNMVLAREGLRTDHTYRHHGRASQGFQMSGLGAWSPYNLAGLRPPHVGQLLKPGTILTYYQAPQDQLFWGWDLASGGLRPDLAADDLQRHIESLGPIDYIDQTGLHPAGRLTP